MLAGFAGFVLAISRADASLQDVQTVFIVLMENRDWSSIRGSASAPYINNVLLPMASRAEQYYNPPGLHPSLPNYIWLEAGTNFNITSNVLPSSGHLSSTNHLVTLLKNAGISWRSYQEDICGCLCPLVNTNLYVPRHNPMVYFDDVTNTNDPNSAYCIANVRTYTQLAGDLQSNTVARYNFITPNQCNNMHNGSGCATSDPVKNGDTWLSNNIPAILNSQAYSNNGVLFITFDEGAGTSDGPIGMIVLSPLGKGGGYSNTIHYTHSSTLRTLQKIFNVAPLLGDAANATDLSDLFITQLSVNPGLGLTSSGPVGGPFNPGSLTYSVSNSAAITLNWAASKSANWITLSSTSGTLSPGSNTTVTVSINPNANSLSANGYSDTITFTNVTNGDGNTTRPVNLTVASTNVSGFGFFDDFSTFTTGNLVGQQSWAQLGGVSTLPLQVSGGQVVIPFGQSVDNQDAYKNFTLTNITVFSGVTLTVSNAPTSTAASYLVAMTIGNNGTGFANYRLNAHDVGGTYVLGARITGESGDPYTFGSALAYATQYRVIVEADSGGTVMKVFVNPTSSNLSAQTPYVINNIGSGTPPPSVGSFVISQFASGTVPNAGVSVGKVVVADNFATVYNNLSGFVPPMASFSANPSEGLEPLSVTFDDTSTGTITNRFWDFGDSSTTNTTTNVVVHSYAAGTYGVTLVTTGPAGVSTNSQPNYITVLTAFQDWQIQFFGNTSDPDAAPNADPDGDGQNNMAEFQAGTDPVDSASAFQITSINRIGTDVLVTWTMGSGKTNALQRTNGVGDGYSTNGFADIFVVTNTVGSITNYLDVDAAISDPALYYHIRLVP